MPICFAGLVVEQPRMSSVLRYFPADDEAMSPGAGLDRMRTVRHARTFLLSDVMLYLRWLGGMTFIAALWWMFGGCR